MPRLASSQTLPPVPLGDVRGIPRPAERHSPSSMSWASSQWDVPGTPPDGGVQEGTPLDVDEQQLYSVLLTIFLREFPATLWRKLISVACIWDIVLSVMPISEGRNVDLPVNRELRLLA
ncbi:hypothetical protein ATANTOWER_015443 [Ataeniobius toweri]|uniref:Uncharacterized protein n=1 Tax=Ataeniobius toweri TaxID=208326 RepID=A0ABU7CHR6_9TELE|nr:hypothetical protein [Ataeniobius toweri]